MWITVLVMAIAVSLEPFRIGMTVVMLNRPRPMLQLLAFLCGGYAMGITVGLVVLLAFRSRLDVSTHLTLPKVQIVIGVLALLIAAALTTGIWPGRFDVPYTAGRARQLMTGRSLWVAGLAGLGIALPSVDYLAVLAVIVASGAAPTMQFGALLMFNIVAFALIEIPLVAYLVAPAKTRSVMTAMHGWIRSRRRPEVAALLAVVGCFLLGAGIAGL